MKPAAKRPARRHPIVQAKLVVGAASDRYEREADAVAAQVTQRLGGGEDAAVSRRVLDAPEHTRISRMAGAAPAAAGSSLPRTRISRVSQPMGMEGGAIDDSTERAIESARSSGKPLGGKIRSRMESAIGADFSGVRVHTGPQSDALNEQLSAKAFTSGPDIFVRSSDYNEGTTDGTRLLAHELTHTVQQGASPALDRSFDPAAGAIAGSVQRATNVIQRWEWWDKRQAAKKKAAEEALAKKNAKGDAAKVAKGETNAGPGLAQNNAGPGAGPGGGGQNQQGANNAGAAAAATPNDKWQGRAGTLKNTNVEIVKPTASVAAAGAAAGGSALGKGTDFAGGAFGAALGPLLIADAGLTLNAAREMGNEAEKYGDKGMSKLAGRKGKSGGQDLLAAGLGTAKGGVDIANASAGTVGQLGHVALGAASGGLGIAAGSAMVLQGAWRGGQAVMKLCRLTWGRGQQMLSKDGDRWKETVVGAEKFKVATNALKIAVGALGIAAGALLIASNPIGWAVGIAAGVAGGIYAITKIVSRIKNASDKEKVKNQIENNVPAEQIRVDGSADPTPKKGEAPKKKESGRGFKKAGEPGPKSNRDKAIEEANKVARLASANARTAAEMRDALSAGDKDLVFKSLEIKAMEGDEPESMGPYAARVPAYLEDMITKREDRKLHDAFQLLSSINIDPDQALSQSGQDLIEQKLSKAESM